MPRRERIVVCQHAGSSVAHESDAVYLDEIEQAGKEHPTFVLHVVVADRDGFLTAEKAAAGRNFADVWVYMCGPPPMTKAFRDGFLGIGIPRSRLRWEESQLAELAV
jgi:ferredoxin-NADP reductase